MKAKKIFALLLALACVFSFAACSGGNAGSDSSDGEVSVFYYNFSDTYISSVRSAMDKLLSDSGVKYNNYDANGNQTTQTEQVTTAIAKGSKLLIVNVVDTGSNDAAQNIVDMAKAQNIPVIFFNRSVDESVVSSYDKCVFVGTDYEMAGHMQGEMIGEYVLANYDKLDLNGDGKISYVMFKGQEGNMEAIARTQYGVEDCNKVLTEAGKPEIEFYDANNSNKYLVDQNGTWASQAATEYMSTILAQYSEAGNNMIELVIANNDDMALAAARTAKDNPNYAKTIFLGFDGQKSAVEAVLNGELTMTAAQNNFDIGYKAVETIVKILNGEEYGDVDTGTEIITKDNAQARLDNFANWLK